MHLFTLLQTNPPPVRTKKEQFTIAAEGEVRIISSKANAIGINSIATATAEAFSLVTDALSNRLTTIERGLNLNSARKTLLYGFYNAFQGENGQKTTATFGGEVNMFKM